MIRSGNPALNDDIFKNAAAGVGRAGGATGRPGVRTSETMTISGTVNKSALLLGICFVTATITWNPSFVSPTTAMGLTWPLAIAGFIIAIVTTFKKTWAPVTAPLYAAVEGAFLGAISMMFEMRFPGIVTQAIIGTMGTFAALLMAYKSGMIKATENFKLGITAATGGVMLVYMASMILGFFGVSVPYIHESGLIGIGFSLVVVVIAALNLVMDFDFIENGEEVGAPKYLEWYGAFALLVTLVWLYLEMLRLLSKLQSRD